MRDTEQIPGVSPRLDPPLNPPVSGSSGGYRFSGKKMFSLGLPQRLIIFALLFAAEWGPLTHWVHKGVGAGALLHVAIPFCCLLFAIGYFRSKEGFQRFSRQVENTPIHWGMLFGHLVAMGAFVGLSLLSNSSGYAIAALWYAVGGLAMLLAAGAFVPLKPAFDFFRTTGYAWVYALIAAVISWRVVVSNSLWNGMVWDPEKSLTWKPLTDLTFVLVKSMLHLFLPQVIADRSTMVIGSPGFRVQILPWCAGFEGTALMFIFSVAWLAYFRKEFRFPQALLLVPAGMLVIWLANAARITALILIGVAGAPNVAMGGFHSQAGWIAFNCVALSFAVYTRHLPWFISGRTVAIRTPANPAVSAKPDPTAAFLTPFLAILAAAMICRAASSGFEWLYPLRFVAAASVLWFFRSTYLKLDWRFGPFSVLAGSAVFGLWLALDIMAGPHSPGAIAAGLAALPTPARIAWLVFRTAAAVVTVPIAEELAFRGFLIRRVSSTDFDSLSPRHYTIVAVLVSSVAFGLLHGDRWLAGTLAGLIYAVAFLRRGRIGDAVVAHATTNALLAAWVLIGGKWDLW